MSAKSPTQETEERTLPRSAVACNACRTRKQKCGGEKPACARCRQLGLDCSWPAKQKRGPAKGYTEALEARLVETEDVLFRALSFISPDEFSRAFGGRWVLSEDVVEGVRSSVVDRKEAVERWSRWPLRSEGDVERWFDERKREGEESGVGDGVERVGRMMVGVGLREMVGGQNKDLRRDSATRLGSITSSRDNEVDSMDYGTGTEISQVRQSQSRQNHLSQAEHLEQSYVSRPQHITPLPLVDIVYDEGIRGQIQETDRSTTANGLGLSRKFQDDFLW